MRDGRIVLIMAAAALALFAPRVGADGTNAPPARHFRIPKSNAVRLQAFKADPPEVALGERLFLETRFAQFFFAHSHEDANAVLKQGDPVVARSASASGEALAGPYSGLSINCRSCHLVAEQAPLRRGNRTYADFARRSPVPAREDGRQFTARNSPPMVNSLVLHAGDLFLHYDGEFGTGADLVKATFTGRNFGWLPTEHTQAIHHIAHVIRHDNGKGDLAREFGGYSYRKVFAGESDIEEDYLIPEEFRLNVESASDEEVLDAIGRVVNAYMRTLLYSRDDQREYDSSPYDVFLEKNQLPRKPDRGQSDSYYIRNLSSLIAAIKEPRYVTDADKCFKIARQDFRFGPLELAGLKIFLAGPSRFLAPRVARDAESDRVERRSIGNCAVCHVPPHFTDFSFHNTGVSQEEYDAMHGEGAFGRIFIPALSERATNYDAWLPPTPSHPNATGTFCEIPVKDSPGRVDLGLWNIFANPDKPAVQSTLLQLLVGEGRPQWPEILLSRTVAVFKTPTLRGLPQSHPYLHNGEKDSLEDVIRFYIKSAKLMRSGKIRNGAPELVDIQLRDEDVAPLAAFLRALNEDYE